MGPVSDATQSVAASPGHRLIGPLTTAAYKGPPAPNLVPGADLSGVQQRAGAATTGTKRPHLKLVTTADPGAAASARDAAWPEFEGTLLTYNEVSVIGTDQAGHYVREKFLAGAPRCRRTGTYW